MREIEKMQAANENIDVPIGILEVMYDDYWGHIDNFFKIKVKNRITDNEIDDLYECVNNLSLHYCI